MMRTISQRVGWLVSCCCVLVAATVFAQTTSPLVRSTKSGPWSSPTTWEGGKLPAAGDRVQIREGHQVVYDRNSAEVLRVVHIAGTLRFTHDKDTQLVAGLIKVQPGDDASEEGFDCEAHLPEADSTKPRPALEIGAPSAPIPAGRTALVRLAYVDGMDPKSCPALVCCGGRIDLHGAPLGRTWLKLGATAKQGDSSVVLAEAVSGWRVGDRLIITATKGTRDTGGTRRPGRGDQAVQTEERTLVAIDGARIQLDAPLGYEHLGSGDYRGEVANLSRNVIVESADPQGVRGHTMYHRGSAGSISYAEFRHLGKENVLGRYSLHFHLVGDTMRGSSVIGASIWDSHNRWITIHGTNYLVVRDCVGYRSVGHGYFLEDGTEVYNTLDRNLAVQAFTGKKLPAQVLPFDANDGAGFWWANSLNSFTRNVACENDRYGFRFEATPSSRFNLRLPIQQPDGSTAEIDIRTLPFVRFDDNEAHCDGKYGVNIGEGVNRVGPDTQHPLIVRNLKIWEVHYAYRPQSPCILAENLSIFRADYGIYHPNYDHHVYRNLYIGETNTEPFNRGHDDDSVQYGPLAVDGATFDGIRSYGMPIVQISDNNPTGKAVTHFRDVKLLRWNDNPRRSLVNLGGGPRPTPKTPTGVPVYLHDYFGPGRHAKVASVKAEDLSSDGLTYSEHPPLTGDESRAAEVKDLAFPTLLQPVDDLPPATVITHTIKTADGKLLVRGTTIDNGTVQQVLVNGQPAKATADNFAQWEATVSDAGRTPIALSAYAIDTAGNSEKRVHARRVAVASP